jgi:GT2 family glycosyltransferase
MSSKSNITVVLNGYKRGKNLDEQIEALNNQTIRPEKIMLWYNLHPWRLDFGNV